MGAQKQRDSFSFKTLGVKGFITTKKGTNSYSPNWDMIRRIELRKFTPEKFKINLMAGRNLLLGKFTAGYHKILKGI